MRENKMAFYIKFYRFTDKISLIDQDCDLNLRMNKDLKKWVVYKHILGAKKPSKNQDLKWGSQGLPIFLASANFPEISREGHHIENAFAFL